MHCKSRDGKDIFGLAYIPNTNEKKMATVVMAHGFNSSYHETKDFAATLAMRGVADDWPWHSSVSRPAGWRG